MTELKAKFRDGLKRFVEEYYEEDQGHLNDNQRSEALALFYLSKVFNKLNPGAISDEPDDILPCIVDGKDDQGVDVIFSQDTHHYLIQCKYRGQKKTESDEDVLKFKEIFNRIHPDVGSDFNKNQKVLDALADIDWKQDTFELLFISLGRASDNILNHEKQDIRPIEHPDLKDIDDRASFRFLSEDDLNMEYRDAFSKKILTKISLEASPDAKGNHWYLYENKGNPRSFITTIKAAQIHTLYQKERQKLFNLNIRNFIGDTSTNKGILKTVDKEPEKFFFYNNGISAIASKVKENADTGKLECENFSIVNGAQTFRSISRAYAKLDGKSKESVKNLGIMIRLTETPDLFKNNDFIERITQYNNTQNAVKISDFRSNDGVQTSLASYFSKISYGGKKYYYKNKRTKEVPRNSITINLDDFCKIIHSFDKGPVDYFGGIKYLYDTNPSGGYYFLFGDEANNSILDSLSEEKFQNFAAKFFICETARSIFDDERKKKIEIEKSSRDEDDNTPLISKRTLEGRYLIFFALGVVFHRIANIRKVTLENFLKSEKFDTPSWRDNKKKMELIENAVKLSCDALVQIYTASSKNPNFVHRNWFREQDTLRELKNNINLANSSGLDSIYKLYSN